jgi:hypothetical protein
MIGLTRVLVWRQVSDVYSRLRPFEPDVNRHNTQQRLANDLAKRDRKW